MKMLNKQSRTAEKGRPPTWRLGKGAVNVCPQIKLLTCYEMLRRTLDYVTSLAQDRSSDKLS
jgi:hypothetical protein